jgi:hypothetical protein
MTVKSLQRALGPTTLWFSRWRCSRVISAGRAIFHWITLFETSNQAILKRIGSARASMSVLRQGEWLGWDYRE